LNTSSLSLDQGPNISVPFRFFYTAPLFFIFFAIALFFTPVDVIELRFSSQTVSLVHLFTLGVLTLIMFGALFQMLPVLMGVVVGGNIIVVWFIHLLLLFGIPIFSFGLYFEIDTLMLIGAFSIAIGIFVFLLNISIDVYRADRKGKSVPLMQVSIASLWIVLLLGILISLSRTGIIELEYHEALSNFHIVIALFGWAFALIVSVSLSIVPMFYVTPEYTPGCRRVIPFIIIGALVSFAILFFIYPSLSILAEFVITQGVLMYAYQTIKRLRRRRRKIPDVTVSYWHTSMITLLLSVVFWWVGYIEPLFFTLSFISFSIGFLGSLLQGMMYKIIPFLVWFHLSSSGKWDIPTIKEIINEEDMWVQLRLYQLFITLFLLSFLFPSVKIVAASILLVSSISLFINVISGWRVYSSLR